MNDLQILYKNQMNELIRLQNENSKLNMSQPIGIFKSPSHTYSNENDYDSDDSLKHFQKETSVSNSVSVPFKLRERSISNSSGIYGIYSNECENTLTQESKTEIYNELLNKFNELNDVINNGMFIGNKQLKERYELLLEKYNRLYKGHKELIIKINNENELRDMKWRAIVNELNERLNNKTNECENVLNAIRNGIKEKQLECKEILNGLVMEVNQILNDIKCEENGIREFKLMKEKEIEKLNEEIEMYKERLRKYEMISEMKLELNEQGNVLKKIKENVCDNTLENKINNIENSLKECVKKENIIEIESVLECIKQNMKSVTLESKMNEIENKLKICVNMMEESMENDSLKNNISELQLQLKDLNENNLNNFKQIKNCINIKTTQNKMNEMENNLKTCINLMGNINDSLKNNINEIQCQLMDEQKILKYIQQNIVSDSKMDEIENNLKINNSLKDDVLEYIKENIINNNNKINGMDNRMEKCINIMKLLGDNINGIQLELNNQQNILTNIEQNMNDNNNKHNEQQNILKDTINKTNNLKNEMDELDEKYNYNNNNNMEKFYNLYETMCEQIDSIRLLYTETNEIKDEEIPISDTDNESEEVKENNNYEIERLNQVIERLNQVIERYKKQIQTMQNIIERLKDCLSQMHDQHIITMKDQKMEYDNLDKIYNNYQIECNKKMRHLTKDLYGVKYKKYNGYKDIVTEMIGNAGMYTKDAIINYLSTQ